MKNRLISIMLILILLMATLSTVVHAATTVTNITVNSVNAPIAGQNWATLVRYTPTISSNQYELNQECGNYGWEWYDRTADRMLLAGDTFIAGHEYTLYVYLKTKAGYEFSYQGSNYTVLISTAAISGLAKTNPTQTFLIVDGDRRYDLAIKYNFGKCGYVDTINSAFIPPVGGNTPSYDKSWTTGYGNIKSYTGLNDGVYIQKGVAWYDLTDVKYLKEDDKFVCDHAYRLIWYIEPDTNYELATESAITSAVNVKINGVAATVEKIQGMQLHAAIQAYVDFPEESHTSGDWEIIKNPKCTKAGLREKFCTKCGKIVQQEAIPATGVHTAGTPVRENEVAATCKEQGSYDEVTYCKDCHVEMSRISKISPVSDNHTFTTVTKKATLSENGRIETRCSVCGEIDDYTIIFHPKTFKLSKTTYTYNGKVQKPSITIKDYDGEVIEATNYTLTYSNKNSKKIGKYTVKVTFKGNYTGSKTFTYYINPKGTSLSKVTKGKKSFKATWKKQKTETTGYEVQYSTDKNFKKGNKTTTIKKNKTTSTTVKKLKAKKTYYVRVRTYKTVSGKKYYSGWSSVKTVKTK